LENKEVVFPSKKELAEKLPRKLYDSKEYNLKYDIFIEKLNVVTELLQ